MTEFATTNPSQHDILAELERHETYLRSRGVTALFIFGSRARGATRPDSDLDVLIDYDPARGFSLLTLAHIQNLLSDCTGLPVQVTTRTSLKQATLTAIEQHALRVF